MYQQNELDPELRCRVFKQIGKVATTKYTPQFAANPESVKGAMEYN